MPRSARAIAFTTLLLLTSCTTSRPRATMQDPLAYSLGTIGGFGELVNSGVKKLALSAVLPPAEMDRLLAAAQPVAERNKVQLYRESDLLVTDLFPADVAKGKDVLLIYQGTTKDEYLQLKADAQTTRRSGYVLRQGAGDDREALRAHAQLSHLAHQPAARRADAISDNGATSGFAPGICFCTTRIWTEPRRSISGRSAWSWWPTIRWRESSASPPIRI